MVESVMFVIISDSYCFTGKGRGVPFSRLFPAICTPCRISLIIIIGCLGVQIGCVCSGCSGGYSLIRLVGVCGRVKGIVCHYFTGVCVWWFIGCYGVLNDHVVGLWRRGVSRGSCNGRINGIPGWD